MDKYNAELERKRQELASRLVQREVVCCMSDWFAWAEEMFHKGLPSTQNVCPVDLEEIPYSQPCDSCDGSGLLEDEEEQCGDCGGSGEIDVEIFEWWRVSSWLGRKLADLGEVVLEREYWGRQCTGQAIALDPSPQAIAWELWGGKDEEEEVLS